MKVTVRKLEVADGAALEKLVVEHVDSIEPGLSVIDARLMLGHATIDLVAQDATGSLVLIALGFRADEGMLLRVVDAYSWCLEYPESVKRHYPTLAVSEDRPPRVMFVMSRVPESFQRKVKQLSFPAVDAVEFHHIEVNGIPTAFFDNVANIRRGVAAHAAGALRAVAPPAPSTPDIAVRPEPRFEPRIEPRIEPRPEPVRLAAEISARLAANGAATKLIETPEPPRVAAAPVIRVAAAVAAATAPIAAAAATIAEPVRVIAGASDATAVIEEPRAVIEEPRAPRSSFLFLPHIIDPSARVVDETEPAGGPSAAENFESEVAAYEASEPAAAVAIPEPESTVAPVAVAPAPAAPVVVAEPVPAPVAAAPVPAAPAVVAEPVPAPVAAAPVVIAEPVPAPVAAAPVEPVAAAPVAAEPAPEQKTLASEAAKAAKLAQELGIQLPEEGALTRQWIDFLNQLAAK
jgi:hypothetical protein